MNKIKSMKALRTVLVTLALLLILVTKSFSLSFIEVILLAVANHVNDEANLLQKILIDIYEGTGND